MLHCFFSQVNDFERGKTMQKDSSVPIPAEIVAGGSVGSFILWYANIIHTSRCNSTLTIKSLVLNVRGLWGLSLGLREHFSPFVRWLKRHFSTHQCLKTCIKHFSSVISPLNHCLLLLLKSINRESLTLFIRSVKVKLTLLIHRLHILQFVLVWTVWKQIPSVRISESSNLPVCVVPETCQNQTLLLQVCPVPGCWKTLFHMTVITKTFLNMWVSI